MPKSERNARARLPMRPGVPASFAALLPGTSGWNAPHVMQRAAPMAAFARNAMVLDGFSPDKSGRKFGLINRFRQSSRV
jgi:hypothetical protein